MQLLGSSPEILVPNEYPFESRFLSYWAKLSRATMGDATGGKVEDWGDQSVLKGIAGKYGPMPYDLDSYVDKKRMSNRMLSCTWYQFSREIELFTGIKYTYYAEKVALDAAPLICRAFPNTKNIFLTRDPRAELASIIAFNKKRGFNGFGWNSDDDIYSFSKRMIESRKRFLANVSQKLDKHSDIDLVLRYEDLMLNLASETQIIGDWLGVDLISEKVIDHQSNYEHHMTNKDPVKSVNSWVNKIPQDVIDYFQKEMGKELEIFGYYADGYRTRKEGVYS
jgi:hypothetical protein